MLPSLFQKEEFNTAAAFENCRIVVVPISAVKISSPALNYPALNYSSVVNRITCDPFVMTDPNKEIILPQYGRGNNQTGHSGNCE